MQDVFIVSSSQVKEKLAVTGAAQNNAPFGLWTTSSVPDSLHCLPHHMETYIGHNEFCQIEGADIYGLLTINLILIQAILLIKE